MNTGRKKIIIYLYNSLFDPLILSNIYLYIKDISKNHPNEFKFSIISYEEKDNKRYGNLTTTIPDELKSLNIDWYPHPWHKGNNLLLKIYDFSLSILTVLKLRLMGYQYIISLASVAGCFAYVLSIFIRLKTYLYQYEPHSEYLVDAGEYTTNDFRYKLLNKLEKLSAKNAKVISSGTKHMQARLLSWQTKADFFKIPSVANEEKFYFSEADRQEIRERHQISESKKVILYPGKFGGLYYFKEIITFFRICYENDNNFHFLIITPNNLYDIEVLLREANIPSANYTLLPPIYTNLQKYYSCADIGLIAVPPGPSRKFVSNIKVGEYLCAGLPYIICKGISEDDDYAIEKNVGIVVNDFSTVSLTNCLPKLNLMLNEPVAIKRKRCREVGINYRGFSLLKETFYRACSSLVAP